MTKIYDLDADIHFGDIDAPLPDWRSMSEDNTEDYDEDEDDPAVTAILGFNPNELDEPQISPEDFSVSYKSFNPVLHPRNPKGSKGGGKFRHSPAPAPAVPPRHVSSEEHAAIALFDKHLQGSAVPSYLHDHYQSSARIIFYHMPTKALKRFNTNVTKLYLYGSVDDLNDDVQAKHKDRINVKRAGGLYDPSDDALYLDGADGGMQALSIYAHEFTHGIDGPNFHYSSMLEWQVIWQKEIVEPWFNGFGITQYATSNTIEGFAEFGRCIYTGINKLPDIEARFPKASAFFKQHGLWPGSN